MRFKRVKQLPLDLANLKINMKIIFLILLNTLLFANQVDIRLKDYQDKYSMCKGKSDYQISKCILNGNFNYANFRGERSAFKRVSNSQIKKAVNEGWAYEFTMQNLPETRRYEELKNYLDYVYTIKDQYVTPNFSGNEEEDIIRMKRVFNLLYQLNIEETAEITPEFEEALLQYQSSHGLTVDGEIGPRTKTSLKIPINALITKIKKNLAIERVTKDKPSNYILVNIPEYTLYYYENYEEVLKMKTVVGKAKMRTPIFNRKMKYVVLNPKWNVPPSIYKKEYAHLSAEELEKKNLRYGSDGKLYQPSGKNNALGLVKFLFPNKFNVYMHDTPAKSKFMRTKRAYSHGCIRLEKPMALLHKLGYDYNKGNTKWKTLENRIPVYIEYHTAWIDESGVIQFRDDVYGYEKKLFSKPVYRKPKPKITNKEALNSF